MPAPGWASTKAPNSTDSTPPRISSHSPVIDPPEGDWARHVGISRDGHSSLSATYNAGKRSIAVDARQAQGRALLLRLAREADIVVQNFRPQVVQRMGVDYDSLRAAGLDPVYVSISGYGPTGPYADRPATD